MFTKDGNIFNKLLYKEHNRYQGNIHTVWKKKCASFFCFFFHHTRWCCMAGRWGCFPSLCIFKKGGIWCREGICVLLFDKSNCARDAKFQTVYSKQLPTRKTIYKWHQRFVNMGCLCSGKNGGRPSVPPAEVECVRQVFTMSPKKSLCCRKILRKKNSFKPCVNCSCWHNWRKTTTKSIFSSATNFNKWLKNIKIFFYFI